ncbi:NADH-quinone oxidoreductase subunit NuoF [Candidatus Magnetomonas plexicatena]|uniref:NADH-quinone oxidoreductase subunit NuoF n=1 Tax=Candidatus Magnetomonas plexicatena TaxID=2552947 RepID=UPI001C76410D|nr:NADH-quinone oxidoreductase subunit NuoF [Nitrospirales bacterium LBB_01]
MKKRISINVCMGTGGIAAGGQEVLDRFAEELEKEGIDSSSHEIFYMHKVGCRGFCARDVLVDVVIDGNKTTYEHITPDHVPQIVSEHIVGGVAVADLSVKEDYHAFKDKQVKVVLSDCGELDPEDIDAYIKSAGYQSIKRVLDGMSPEDVIGIIKGSGLRGRGGAGFPTGLKWEFGRKEQSSIKYLICNADEGDPGAFMDRSVVEGNPHLLIEGMAIGAYAIGADKGYVYIRAEYPLAVERLRLALNQSRERGYLGKNILGSNFNFDIKIKLGAGAFVCGEETALIASIEGKRGMPKAKPPFPAQKGLFGKPTIINNVETLANVPYIIRNGAEWFASMGTEKSKGTKVFALTGKVKNTGLIEVPMGITLREIIYDIGGGIEKGKKFKAVQTGGPSGGCLTEDLLDISVDYESLGQAGSIMGSGGMVVLDEDNCMVNIAKYFLEFTQNESCGKCTPCRVGTKRLLEILDRITEGRGKTTDMELLEDLSRDIIAASLCGLGQTAPNPILSTLKRFRGEYEAHIFEKRCPAGVCKALLTYTIDEAKCTGCTACSRVCPVIAITGEKKKPHRIDQALCVKCNSCFEACKFKSIKKV